MPTDAYYLLFLLINCFFNLSVFVSITVMKYQKLHKFNSRQQEDDGTLCWPPENAHHRNRSCSEGQSNYRNDDPNTLSNNNSHKVRSLVKAMNRVLSGGDQQQPRCRKSPPRIPSPPVKNQQEEKNGSRERVSQNLDAKWRFFFLPLESFILAIVDSSFFLTNYFLYSLFLFIENWE